MKPITTETTNIAVTPFLDRNRGSPDKETLLAELFPAELVPEAVEAAEKSMLTSANRLARRKRFPAPNS